jgi:hypothetical protein
LGGGGADVFEECSEDGMVTDVGDFTYAGGDSMGAEHGDVLLQQQHQLAVQVRLIGLKKQLVVVLMGSY